MRFFQKVETILSEDEVSVPKIIQFQEVRTIVESGTATALKDGGGRTETIPTATVDYEIAMGKITIGKWFYFFSDVDFDLKIDDGPARRILSNKPCSMHMNFSSLKVSTIDTSDLRLTWAVAGD